MSSNLLNDSGACMRPVREDPDTHRPAFITFPSLTFQGSPIDLFSDRNVAAVMDKYRDNQMVGILTVSAGLAKQNNATL